MEKVLSIRVDNMMATSNTIAAPSPVSNRSPAMVLLFLWGAVSCLMLGYVVMEQDSAVRMLNFRHGFLDKILNSDVEMLKKHGSLSSEIIMRYWDSEGATNESIVDFWKYLGEKPAPIEERPPSDVHFFSLDKNEFSLLEYLSIRSAYLQGKAERIYIHMLSKPSEESPIWKMIKPMVTKLVIEPPASHAFEKELVKGGSLDDLYKLAVLSKYGGIVMETTSIQMIPFDYLLAAPSGVAFGWRSFSDKTPNHKVASNTIVATKNHTFLLDWLKSYEKFKPYDWKSLAGPSKGLNYLDYKKTTFPRNTGPQIDLLLTTWQHKLDILDPTVFSVIPDPVNLFLEDAYEETVENLLPDPFFTIKLQCVEDRASMSRLVNSLLSQRYQGWEAIVPPSCTSMDKEFLNDSRFRYEGTEKEQGVWEINTDNVVAFEEESYLSSLLNSMLKTSSLEKNEVVKFINEDGNINASSTDLSNNVKVLEAERLPYAQDAMSNCSVDLRGNKPVLDTINVVPVTSKSPTVLCYVLCNAAYHDRARIIKETWGSRCDRFIVASDEDDEELGAIAIKTKTPHSWLYLWDKHRELIRYLYNNNIAQQYDWIFKADTDTYVIPENLKNHLSQLDMSKPQIVGCKFSFPIKVRGNQTGGFDLLPRFEEYFKIQKEEDKWQYASGAGFAMNMDFLDKFMSKIDEDSCSPNLPRLSEDFGCAACVSTSYPLSPASSRDKYGREMYHIWAPLAVTTILSSYPRGSDMYWWHENHIPPHNPVPLTGTDSYSRESVLWHRIDDELFYYMFNQLYKCREQQHQPVPPKELLGNVANATTS